MNRKQGAGTGEVVSGINGFEDSELSGKEEKRDRQAAFCSLPAHNTLN